MRRSLRRSWPVRWSTGAAALGVVVLLSVGPAAGHPLASKGAYPPAPPKIPKLDDGGNLTAASSGSSTLSDAESSTLFGPGTERSYWVNLTASGLVASGSVEVQTDPTTDWAGAAQFPWGADNLPPLSDWTWWVLDANGTNDTSNWSADSNGIYLDRTTAWGNSSFEIHGLTTPQVDVGVTPGELLGQNATGTGFVMNAPGYVDAIPSDPNYANLTGSIHPALVRISLGIGGQITGWNSTTNQPTFSFAGLDAQFELVESIGASVLLSLPAGTFGDGNDLPNGTPLNHSVQVTLKEGTGYFPTPAAYYAIVQGIANHTSANHEAVEYWSIGNEVVLNSSLEAQAFASVINAAIDALHSRYPDARVGTDDMMDPRYLPEFANLTPRVGFLSLHRYASDGLCVTANGSYCPPSGAGAATPTPEIFQRPQYQGGTSDRLPPITAADDWYNLTGHHVPVLTTEVNLGYVGGPGAPNQSLGTDPRTQSLIGASWLGEFLIASSEQNVSAINFFAFTSGSNQSGTLSYAYGGFGFGLTNETPNGTVNKYAPYWTMELWGSYLPFGAPAVALNDSDPGTVDAYAVQSGNDIDVALANEVAENTTVHLAVAGNYSLNRTLVLDSTTYQEAYHPASNSTSIAKSGIRTVRSPATQNVTIHGYGFAVAVFAPAQNSSGGGGSGSNGSGNGSNGSGGGSGNNSGSGNQSGNQSGNGSSGAGGSHGNSSGNSSGNNSGNQSVSGNVTNGSNSSSGSNSSRDGTSNQSTNRSADNGTQGNASPPPTGPTTPPGTSAPPSGAAAIGQAAGSLRGASGSRVYAVVTVAALIGAAVLAFSAGRSTRRPQNAARYR